MSDTLDAGRELDALVAEKVMGFTVERGVVHYDGAEMPWEVWHDGADATNPVRYSTDIAAAWLVVEKMRGEDWCYQVAETEPGEVVCWFFRGGVVKGRIPGMTPPDAPITPYRRGIAATAPLAICRAALAAQPASPIGAPDHG